MAQLESVAFLREFQFVHYCCYWHRELQREQQFAVLVAAEPQPLAGAVAEPFVEVVVEEAAVAPVAAEPVVVVVLGAVAIEHSTPAAFVVVALDP